MKLFEMNISDHHWIDRDPANTYDECSHGKFHLELNGHVILGDEDTINDWTTSSSVLRLLRTIDKDFLEHRDFGVLLHCGGIDMISCPISVDWLLWHEDEEVCIKDVKKYPTWNDKDVIEFPDLIARIPKKIYSREIVKVARQVKEFFMLSQPRKYFDDVARQNNKDFWEEFDSLMAKHS